MTLPLFDQLHLKDDGRESLVETAGGMRLYYGLLPRPATFRIDGRGIREDIPAKKGIDVTTASFMQIINFMADTRMKKSGSEIHFLHKCLALKFPTEYAQHKPNIEKRFKIEYEMIQSNAKNDLEYLGESDYSGYRHDGSLFNPKNKKIKKRDGSIKIVRK